ncbi:MAG: inositol monophosphatase family protein [Acidobacteriota bacterium]
MSGMALRDLLAFAVEVAEGTGEVTLAHFRSGVDIELKPDTSPVTVADREAERWARNLIEARFPADGIIGEELGSCRTEAPRRWILDPIDGTASYVRGVPLYGVLVAVEEGDQVVAGVLHFPALDETLAAARGEGCLWNGAPARVSEVERLHDALILCTDAEELERRGHEPGWNRLRSRCSMVRTWGDCYGHALVASGRAEAMLDPILARWDAAALRPVVEEAGGVFTDWKGQATHRSDHAISTNAALAGGVRELLGAKRETPAVEAAPAAGKES